MRSMLFGPFVAVSRVDSAMFFALTKTANGLIANLVTRWFIVSSRELRRAANTNHVPRGK